MERWWVYKKCTQLAVGIWECRVDWRREIAELPAGNRLRPLADA